MSDFELVVKGVRAVGQDVRALVDQFLASLEAQGHTVQEASYTHHEPVADQLRPAAEASAQPAEAASA